MLRKSKVIIEDRLDQSAGHVIRELSSLDPRSGSAVRNESPTAHAGQVANLIIRARPFVGPTMVTKAVMINQAVPFVGQILVAEAVVIIHAVQS